MVYVKIVIGSLIWGVILWNIGDYIFEQDRERTCTSEVRKSTADKSVVKENCLATAESYFEKEEYGSASWYYLLAGDVDKNINEIEGKISDDFYINIGHSYVLKNDFEKAGKIYADFIFADSGGYLYTNVNDVIKEDYQALNNIYPKDKERLEKGLKLWEKVYAPVGKMVNAYESYEKAESDDNSTGAIAFLKEAIEQAETYKYEEHVEYAKWIESLAELYYDEEEYKEAITYYTKVARLYENDKEKQLSYADSLFWIAKSHYYLAEYENAINYYKKTLPLYVEAETNSSYNIGYVYHNIGNSYSEEENQTLQLEAVKYYQKSIEHKKLYNAEEFDSLARSYNNMGDVYYKVKKYNEAKEAHEKAIELEKKMFNEEEKDEDEIEETLSELDTLASYHQNLSDTYRELNDMNASVQVQDDYLSFIEKNYGDYKLTLAESYETVASYFQNRERDLSFEYYQKGLDVLDKNGTEELLDEKKDLTKNIVGEMLYVCEEISYDDPVKGGKLLKELITYQENNIPNKRLLAKSYSNLASLSKENNYLYQKKSLKLFQEYITENGELSEFSTLVNYYDNYVETYAKNGEKDKAVELMDGFIAFAKQHYPENKKIQFEVYASSSYMYKVLADYERSIEDITKASKFKNEAFEMDCKELEDIYDVCNIYLDPESIPKLAKACETMT